MNRVNYRKDLLESTSYFNYDSYGNPSHAVSIFKDNSSLAEVYREEAAYTYNNVNNGSNWIIGQLSSVSTDYIRNGNTTSIDKEYHYFSNGALEYDYIHKNSPLQIKQEYGYDSFGNLTSKTIKAENDPDISSGNRIKTTTYNYFINGRFLDSVVDPLGNTISLE